MDNDTENFQDNRSNSSAAYLQRAASAVEAGDNILGIHLYLAAYERALCEGFVPSNEAMAGMEKAWDLAVATKQRALAEYIFEKLENYWPDDEMARHADELQRMAFDKLEEYGFDRDSVEDMAEMINEEMLGGPADVLAHFQENEAELEQADVEGHLSQLMGMIQSAAEEVLNTEKAPESDVANTQASLAPAGQAPVEEAPQAPSAVHVFAAGKNAQQTSVQERFDYSSLVGFGRATDYMKELGVGLADDPDFAQFVAQLNLRHGLPAMPPLGTLMFSCPAREDANYFMVATVGELRMPAIRMRLDQNAQGQAVLCVMASPDFKMKLQNLARTGFAGPTAVILEDLDLWDLPVFDSQPEDFQGFVQMQLSRGAREALALIQSAVDNPEVTLLVSAADPDDIDGYFLDMIGQHRIISIDLPNAEERREVWRANQTQHPSLRGMDVSQLVDFSRSLSRYEIFAIANEVVEDAYRDSVAAHQFRAVKTDDMLARLANFQELESDEYQRMEDIVVDHFRRETHNFDDLLEG